MATLYSVVWFKRDLRIHDHAPLFAAACAGLPIVPLYIVEPEYWRLPDVSARHWHFIHDSLVELRQALHTLGAPLLIRVGKAVEVMEYLRQSYGAFQLYSHEETGNAWTYQRDQAIGIWCKTQRIHWEEFPSHGVIRRLYNRDEWAIRRNAHMQQPIIALPASVSSLHSLDQHALPQKNDRVFKQDNIGWVQPGGRAEGIDILCSFLQVRAHRYRSSLSKPGISARHCSRLSPHIAYGTLSVKEIEQSIQCKVALLADIDEASAQKLAYNLTAFLSRLAWRCHFVQKLEQQPEIETLCMHPYFEGMREPHFNPSFLQAWQTGTTGYPLIDASMRALHKNGWINFRMRAMLVSFASYQLWLDWRQTAPVLAQLFTDYEPGIHYSQFQMQSCVTGINSLRIYHPVKQSYEHDPKGMFIKQYVPELRHIPPLWIHEPWRMPSPPKNYPLPIVDHTLSTQHARQEIALRWAQKGFKEVARQVLYKLGSRTQRTRQKKVISEKQLTFKF
jgi:deoxyribodipyrimidine photo-lyase